MAKKSVKLDHGTVYQKQDNGNFFFRFQVNGRRKAVSLKTKNLREARRKAEEMLPLIHAPSPEVVAAHVLHANFGVRKQDLRLGDAWDTYASHPDKATPATVSEQLSYRATWHEFIAFVGNDDLLLGSVTPDDAVSYADHMRTREIAVDTHNRKIRRLRKIFATLKDYRGDTNPFAGRQVQRKRREEQNAERRLSFTKEQEQQLLQSFDVPGHRLKNKDEVRILFNIGIFTGQRLKDCALLQWNQVHFNRRRIWVRQFKTGKKVTIPIADQLLEALQEAKTWQRDEYVLPSVADRYLTTDRNGKNVGANLLNIDVMRVIRWIGVEPSVKVPGRKKKVTIYGFHSLRHSFASHCAEAGVPKAVAQSILGADSDIIDKYYVHIGEEAQEKAIRMISGNVSSLRRRYEKALDYLARLKNKTAELQEVERILRGTNL